MEYKLKKPVSGTIGTTKYQCTIQWRNGKIISDEPEEEGGKGTGPDPFTLILSALASCTLITLRMYIDRKGWDIKNVVVNTNLFQTEYQHNTIIDHDIYFPGAQLTPEQKKRLGEIAAHCPISKILEANNKVRTFVFHDEDVEKKRFYSNGEITVVWKPAHCQHSGRCVTQLPSVFNLETKPWVTITAADTQTIIDQVNYCPSGALTFFYDDENLM